MHTAIHSIGIDSVCQTATPSLVFVYVSKNICSQSLLFYFHNSIMFGSRLFCYSSRIVVAVFVDKIEIR